LGLFGIEGDFGSSLCFPLHFSNSLLHPFLKGYMFLSSMQLCVSSTIGRGEHRGLDFLELVGDDGIRNEISSRSFFFLARFERFLSHGGWKELRGGAFGI